jgi:hypothetical protein
VPTVEARQHAAYLRAGVLYVVPGPHWHLAHVGGRELLGNNLALGQKDGHLGRAHLGQGPDNGIVQPLKLLTASAEDAANVVLALS